MMFPWSGFRRLKVSEMALSRNDLFTFWHFQSLAWILKRGGAFAKLFCKYPASEAISAFSSFGGFQIAEQRCRSQIFIINTIITFIPRQKGLVTFWQWHHFLPLVVEFNPEHKTACGYFELLWGHHINNKIQINFRLKLEVLPLFVF